MMFEPKASSICCPRTRLLEGIPLCGTEFGPRSFMSLLHHGKRGSPQHEVRAKKQKLQMAENVNTIAKLKAARFARNTKV